MIVGTAGHIDHGKTSLVRALTGVDTDRLKEEKARGISIDLGFAYLPAPDGGVLGFVDVPGHERLVHNMLAGATGIDFVLLAVAADDGLMPQTAEHVAIVDLLGIDTGIVAITKTDLVSAERLAEVRAEIAQALSGTVLADAEMVAVSSETGEGIDALRARLFEASKSLGPHASGGRFRMAVDRCFTLPGVGTVVTGTILSGSISTGGHVVVSPSGFEARVRGIHAHNRPADVAKAGARCALNLAGEAITKEAISRGDVVLDPQLHAPTDRIDAAVRVLRADPKPLTQWMPVRLHHAAAEIGARVVLLDETPPAPGADVFVQLVLEAPVAAAAGDRFVIRDTSAQRTIGGGRFLDLRAPARKRRTPERRAQLEAHSIGDAGQALTALLDRAPHFVDFSSFVRDRALAEPEIGAIAEQAGLIRLATPKGEIALSPAVWQTLKRSVLIALSKFHAGSPDLAGMGLEKLRRQTEPRLPAPAFTAVLQAMARAGDLSLDGAAARLTSHDVRLAPQDELLWSKVGPMIGGPDRFRPPRVPEIAGLLNAKEPDIKKLFKALARVGKVVEVAQDHFFLRGTVAEMAGIAAEISASAPDGQFTAAQLRDRLDNGRKVAIQILEFFDRHGVTVRRGDLRRVDSNRVDLFGRPAEDAKSISGGASSPVGRPDFKSGRGRQTVLGGFDSHSLPPNFRKSGS
jgi:selenocysteine-specific elongation factor